MVLFNIPDIRLFWSEDERFLKQFDENKPLSEMRFEVRRGDTAAGLATSGAPLAPCHQRRAFGALPPASARQARVARRPAPAPRPYARLTPSSPNPAPLPAFPAL